MDLKQGGNGYDWFFMAMVVWQRNDRVKALQWYDQAVRWLEKGQDYGAELQQLRVEAAQLLGRNQP